MSRAGSAIHLPSPRRSRSGVIRRNRTINSCAACRTRRVKCDKTRPTCGRCLNEGKTCLYVGRYGESPLEAAENSSTGAQSTQSPKRLRNTAGESAGQPVVLNKVGRPERLALHKGGRSRYMSNSVWAILGEQSCEFDELITSLPIFPLNSCDCSAATSTLRLGTSESLAQNYRLLDSILAELPPRHVCEELYTLYVESVHPILPLLHMPTFRTQFGRFWEWYERWDRREVVDGVLLEIPGLLPVLFAVLFAGCISNCNRPFTSSGAEDAYRVSLSSKLHRATTHVLTTVSFPQSPTVYSLIAFLIAQNMLIREEEAMSSCSFVSVALRVAQAMGMHRDGKHFNLDRVQAEVRRRIWWHIIHTDVMTALCSGISPVLTNDNMYDTEQISELREELLTADAFPEVARAVQSIDLGLYVAQTRYAITSVMRNLLRRQFEVRNPITPQEIERFKREIDDINALVTERIQKINNLEFYDANERVDGDASASAGEPKSSALRLWSQKLLWLMLHRTYFILYQPLSRLTDQTMWKRVRKDCIEHCHVYIRVFLEMCTSQDFHPFYWMYPGVYQPLQTTAMLIVDLAKNPGSDESVTSRELIEKVFALQGPDGINSTDRPASVRHLSKSGKEAWEMLKMLKRQVWEKAGLDSSKTRKEKPEQSSSFAALSHTIGGNQQESRRLSMGDIQPEQAPSRDTFPPTCSTVNNTGGVSVVRAARAGADENTVVRAGVDVSASMKEGYRFVSFVPAPATTDPPSREYFSAPVLVGNGAVQSQQQPGAVPYQVGVLGAQNMPVQPQEQPAQPQFGPMGPPVSVGGSEIGLGGMGYGLTVDDMDWRLWDALLERCCNLPDSGHMF